MKAVLFTVLAIVLSFGSLSAQQWEPHNELGDLYPSLAIALSNFKNDGAQKVETDLGDPNGFMGIRFTPDHANTRVRLEMRCNNGLNLFEPAVIETVAPEAGVTYFITPLMPFNHAKLATLRQPVAAYVTYTLTVDGQPQLPRTEPLQVRSINDCPFAFLDEDAHEVPIDFVFAAYVNENHPLIQPLLQEALRKGYVEAFSGYAGGRNPVYQQVMAVWRVLQERGIRYSNITAVIPNAEGVASQHVRLLDETIRYTQANCADATVLLASILRRININPILVILPGHMLIGFDLDEEGNEQAYLETTLLGVDARSTGIADNRLYKTLLNRDVSLKAQVAVKSFLAALESGEETYAESKDEIRDEKPGYATVDIAAAREAGVLPIQYVK